jgi:1-acyl-sn-glycerol-3-phosphate acyltransferase
MSRAAEAPGKAPRGSGEPPLGPDEPQVGDPFDPRYLGDLVGELFGPLTSAYFRPRLLGHQNLPDSGPLILACNHSGTAFPYDGMVLDALLWRRDGMDPDRKLRSVFEKGLSFTWWMRPFGIDNFWRRGGGVDMTFDNFDRLLARGERVGYFPEGVPGIGKGFQNRYQLQRFSSSFVIMAARHKAPVVPVYIVNAEWILPFNFTVAAVDRRLQKWFGIPFMPLPAGLLSPIFPFLFYLALPARIVFVVGEPIDVARLVAQEGEEDLESPDRERMRAVAERVRRHMQKGLDAQVERYGRRPYGWRSLKRSLRRPPRPRSLLIPFTWTWTFVRHARDRERPPARSRVHSVLRDWDLLFYYVPLGWFLLALTRRLRKPPAGYRGLSRKERAKREGAFVWHLAERPLPPRADGSGA